MNTKDEKKVISLIKNHIAAREVLDVILKDINIRRSNALKMSAPGLKLKSVSCIQAEAMYDAYSNLQDQLVKLRQAIIR